MEKYDDEITSFKREKVAIKIDQDKKTLNRLSEYLLNSEEFKTCTNSPARKAFVRDLHNSPVVDIDLSEIASMIINKTTEDAWQQIRLHKTRMKK